MNATTQDFSVVLFIMLYEMILDGWEPEVHQYHTQYIYLIQ